ncbi:MAG TPA: hypothetical protein VKP78_03150 [bacterium]|nr:hypothetical protein [bacterium]
MSSEVVERDNRKSRKKSFGAGRKQETGSRKAETGNGKAETGKDLIS